MPNPTVSVLMTAYNREKYIASAIQSVLASTFTDFELIIVDDNSTDNTVEIAKKFESLDYRVKVYINEKNFGDYINRNIAASYASGIYLKYLDSDDLIYPHGMEVMVRAMNSFPLAGIGIVGRNNQDNIPYPYVLAPREAYKRHFFKDGLLDTGPSGLIIRSEVFKKIGGFSGKRFIGDTEIVLRITSQWPLVVISSSLVFWRIHDGQEFVLGHTSTGYLELTLPMLEVELNKPECPLEKQEVSRILKYNKSIVARHLLRIALIDYSPYKSLKLFRQLRIGWRDIKHAIFLFKNISK